jgi:Tfp pilus assembly PilM family ATPase/Tfp pilus assembly protein PilN
MVKGFRITQLGINLGPAAITIAELSGKEVIRQCRQELSSFGANLEEIAGDEIKFAAVIQKMLRECEFSGRDVFIALPANDVVVRFFQIPLVLNKEISSTVSFEARKYIPFRIEELVYDFVSRKKPKNLDIIFAATKKKSVDRYLKVLNQVGLNILSIEPASLSFLRLVLAKVKINLRQAVLIVNLDSSFLEGDIIILDGGIPCFTRDVRLFSSVETAEQKNPELILTKLINEIRISIDYFRHRQLSIRSDISSVYIFSESSDLGSWLEAMSQELSIKCFGYSPVDILGIDNAHCDLLKASGAALRGTCRFFADLALFKREKKVREKEAVVSQVVKSIFAKPSFKKFSISILIVIFLIIVSSLAAKTRVSLVEKESQLIIASNSQKSPIIAAKDLSVNEIKRLEESLTGEIKQIESTVEDRFYLTEKIKKLPLLLPDGVWLESLNFRKESSGLGLTLDGLAYSSGNENALTMINKFVSNLKEDSEFNKSFKEIILASVKQSKIDEFLVRVFQVICR